MTPSTVPLRDCDRLCSNQDDSPPQTNTPHTPRTPDLVRGASLDFPNANVPRTPDLRYPSSLSAGSPPRSPFNARTASAQCRLIEGYVSFAAVEGLGKPADLEDDDDQADEERTRTPWSPWKLWPLSS